MMKKIRNVQLINNYFFKPSHELKLIVNGTLMDVNVHY